MLFHVEVGLTKFGVPCIEPVGDMELDGFGECFAFELIPLVAACLVLKNVGIPHDATVEPLGIAPGNREGKLAVFTESRG